MLTGQGGRLHGDTGVRAAAERVGDGGWGAAASVEGGRPADAVPCHVRRDVLAAIHQRAHRYRSVCMLSIAYTDIFLTYAFAFTYSYISSTYIHLLAHIHIYIYTYIQTHCTLYTQPSTADDAFAHHVSCDALAAIHQRAYRCASRRVDHMWA